MSIQWDVKGLKHIDDELARALGISAHLLQDEIRDAQVIPRMDGTLSGEAFKVDDSHAKSGVVRFSFNTPYARRLYYHPEYNFRTDQNPNAQGLWLRHWQKKGKHAKRPKEIFESLLKMKL